MANETITGKIFTLKDPTGTYNRFPRTVMEAVYGLNTYLQNQFSSLADIYMPIEGITESKPLQEFVYRACPSSIKAKSVSLDRIYGKTLVWNQVFNDLVHANVIINDGTYEIANSGIDTYIVMTAMAGHKYLYSIHADVPSGAIVSFGFPSQVENEKQIVSGINNWIGIAPADNRVVFDDGNNPSGAGIKFNHPQLIDLTLLYGSAIDGMTDDEILAKFESEFPGYHSYEPGKLISNDAESIETVGFNQWDEECTIGDINIDGSLYNGGDNFRSKNYIPVVAGETYYFKKTTRICFYDKNKTPVGSRITLTNNTYTAPANACYIMIDRRGAGSSYTHDICINLSDPAKNGTYEPYRKSTMQLNLGSFQVRDSQGNVTTITGGLKSDRSGKYDEIIGNKFIQRAARRAYQSGDENDQTVVTDRTNTDYGLATPIEYELVSPLVPTVKAGTTEARISPNADGLSAPMVADMTYDAQANNDSASAQYALTAGRLLNSHKLWGHDFDGTGDVAGALTGVTNLNSLLYFGSNNVGIGQSNPQYKLDVSGTFRATGAATFGSTIHAAGGIDSDSYITAGAVNSSSDARLKDNITSVVDAMDTIMSLKPSEWIWNEKHHLNGQKGAGLVAQEVERVLPFAVAKEGEYLSLNYNVFHAYEIAGLQNHEERIKALEAENAELRRRLGA